ncbi:MAG: hypothetical protein ACI8VC_002853 [Candidatus Endobugula sp.]|jgi:hypothetical protein
MVRLFILLTLLFLMFLIVRELKKYFTRDQKEEELRDTFIEGDLADIELEITEEKSRQESVRTETDELRSENSTNESKKNTKEKNNE